MSAALFVIGAVLVTAGAALIFWPLSLIVAGLLCLAAGYDLADDGDAA